MSVKIVGVRPNTPADYAGIQQEEVLIKINGHEIMDVLDYRFYETSSKVVVELQNIKGENYSVSIRKGEYEPIGLEFETYLMDKQHSCRNKCIFCFIDQLPKGLRKTLYFKDDDSRLSFLFGNYITLTNLTEHEVERIIKMHISPINISVHTTNPDLRVKMMGNRFAGAALQILKRFTEAGIKINCQLVLCPGINDGKELEKTLFDLYQLGPAIQSIAAVPVGLTKYRDGLYPLRPFRKAEAAAVIDIITDYGTKFSQKTGERVVYPADEFYLIAEQAIPPAEFYGEFSQLENGVGLMASLKQEFYDALIDYPFPKLKRKVTLISGMSAYQFIDSLLDEVRIKCNNLICNVEPIANNFFGDTIDVTGLVTGQDILAQLKGKDLGDELLVPAVMLRHEGDIFLDDVSLNDLQEKLNIKVRVVKNDGYELLDAVTGSDVFCQNL